MNKIAYIKYRVAKIRNADDEENKSELVIDFLVDVMGSDDLEEAKNQLEALQETNIIYEEEAQEVLDKIKDIHEEVAEEIAEEDTGFEFEPPEAGGEEGPENQTPEEEIFIPKIELSASVKRNVEYINAELFDGDGIVEYLIKGGGRPMRLRPMNITDQTWSHFLDWMKQEGFETIEEFKSAVVSNPELLDRAMAKIKEIKRRVMADTELAYGV